MTKKKYQQVSIQLPCGLVDQADCLASRWGSTYRGRAHVIELALEIFMESNAPSYGHMKAWRRERLAELKARDRDPDGFSEKVDRFRSNTGALSTVLELLALCERLDRASDGTSELYPVSELDLKLIEVCAERFRALHKDRK
jgi:hypothetical protein